MWQHCFHLSEWDNMTSAKALWTSKSTFISMTLNSLPIKDKSPFHTRSSICQCHHTKEGGNLFMPNMPPVSTFGRPFEHCFLIKRGSLSSLFFNRNVSLIQLSSAWNSHDNISFNYSFIVTTIQLPFNPSLLLKPTRIPTKTKSDTQVCIETALIFSPNTHWQEWRGGGGNGFYLRAEGTRTAWRKAMGWWRMGERHTDEWNGAQCKGMELTQLPSSHTSAASLFTLTGG